jgi:MFS family permease
MTLASKAEDVVVLATFYSFIMLLLAIVSAFMTGSYLVTGEVEAWASVGACMVGMFAMLIVMCATTIPTAMRVAKESGTRESQRALYVFLLLPLVFLGVMVGNSANYFLNVLIFGWPLFLVSSILMFLAASWLRTEAKLMGFKVRCGSCDSAFDVDRDETVACCHWCGAPNWNPLRPEARRIAERRLVAYEARMPQVPAEFTTRSGESFRNLKGSVVGFLIVTSACSMAGGLVVLYYAWDEEEALIGLGFTAGGIIGLYALYQVARRGSFFAPVVASAVLLTLALFAFILFAVCGVLLGGFAVVTFYLSVQLWMRTGRGRKIRVPAGTVGEEAFEVTRSR